MFTFEVMGGLHADGDSVYKRGDQFESELEMDKLHGDKFRRVSENEPAVAAPMREDDDFNSDLKKMPLEELRQFAEGEEIDLGEAKKKADVLRVILEALGE